MKWGIREMADFKLRNVSCESRAWSLSPTTCSSSGAFRDHQEAHNGESTDSKPVHRATHLILPGRELEGRGSRYLWNRVVCDDVEVRPNQNNGQKRAGGASAAAHPAALGVHVTLASSCRFLFTEYNGFVPPPFEVDKVK